MRKNISKNSAEIFILNFENHNIEIWRKRVKYARIRIDKSGNIKASVPLFYTKKLILDMLYKHKIWIKKTISKQLSLLPPKDSILLLGKIYKLNLNENATNVHINDYEITACDTQSLHNYKLALAKDEFNKIINKFLPFVKREVKRVVVRKMTSRWGSCNHKKGYINLNFHLIEKHYEFIEYVILHELTHLIFPHHQKSFYDFIEGIMPDYKERQRDRISPKEG